MIKRFFKLLYVLCLTAIVLSLPIYLTFNVGAKSKELIVHTYNAKCKSNNQYIILQGDNTPYKFDSLALDRRNDDIPEILNFYCKYWGKNLSYYDNIDVPEYKVYAYPELFNLEVVKTQNNYLVIFGFAIAEWVIGGLIAFVILQFLRICYVYIVFGKLVWHPFKKIQ